MALFNFNFNAPSKPADDNNSSSDETTEKLPVVIQLNEDAMTISAEDAEGMTIADLFQQHGDDLGDVERINRYVAAGQIVDANSKVVLGTVYRGSVTSESKGNAYRINYFVARQIVDADSKVMLGTVYRGSVKSECFGSN